MLFAVCDITALCGKKVVVTGGRDVGNHHPVFDPFLEIDVVVERNIRPVVDQLYGCVLRTNAVNSPESLDNAHRVPVDIVVDQVITILKVLPLRNTVSTDEDIELSRLFREHKGLLFSSR